jgi:O-antigen ligase
MKPSYALWCYRFSIILTAFILPSAFYGWALGLLSLSFVFWLYFRDYKNLYPALKRPEVYFAVFLYLYVLVQFFFAEHFKESLATLSTKLPILLYPVVLGSSSVIDRKLVQDAGKAFILSLFVFLAFAIGYAFYDVARSGIHSLLIGESMESKFSSYGLTRVYRNWHPSYVAMFTNLAIGLLLKMLLEKKQKLFFIIISVFLVAFFIWSLYLLDSVTGFVACVVVFLYFFIMYLRKIRAAFLLKASIVIVMLAAVFSFFYMNPFHITKIQVMKDQAFTVTDRQEARNVLTIRLAKWDAHWTVIKRHWLFGTTEGDIRYIRKEVYLEKGYTDLAQYNYNAHNQYIEDAATYGIAGLILFFCFLLAPLFISFDRSFYILFLLVTGIAFMTETIFNRQQGLNFFMFFYAMYACRKCLPTHRLFVNHTRETSEVGRK